MISFTKYPDKRFALHLLKSARMKIVKLQYLTCISLLILGLGCNSTKNAASRSNGFNGNWAPVKEELGGSSLPPATFESQRLVLGDSAYTFTAESVDKGVVRTKDDKMDIYGREGTNAGKHFMAIFKFENGELTICYNLSGDSYPAAFDTKGKSTLLLVVFKKMADK
jgi:uncharacterized protein (TIGR03067 family)